MKNWNYIEGAKVGNICSGNKKQDWDVGGNIDWDVGNFNGQWYVTKNGQKLVGPFMSMKEAERYLDGHKWELQNKYGNSKIGNDTPWEYAHRKPKVINEDKTGAEEFFKQLSDDVKEREEKDDADIEKVGNKTYKVKESSGHDGGYDYGYIVVDESNRSVGRTFSTRSEAEEYIKDLYKKEKVGNFKTGTSQLKPGDRVQSYGVQGTVRKVEGENSDNIYGEPIIEVEWDNGTVKKVGEHYLRKIGNKVGNSKTGNAKDKNDKDLKIGDIVDVRGKKGKITKIIGDVIEVFYDNSGTYNPDRIDRHYADEATKVGNSASDDKFAYVMREFDEGKLKTPDGKVVTDPAQAKAIAYSESKKTENGLARARKAMNKGITMWKENDSAYIKEDGTVSYLENNSFETDKDKFESQESAIKELSKQGYVKK